jgi:hypothetical protein
MSQSQAATRRPRLKGQDTEASSILFLHRLVGHGRVWTEEADLRLNLPRTEVYQVRI